MTYMNHKYSKISLQNDVIARMSFPFRGKRSNRSVWKTYSESCLRELSIARSSEHPLLSHDVLDAGLLYITHICFTDRGHGAELGRLCDVSSSFDRDRRRNSAVLYRHFSDPRCSRLYTLCHFVLVEYLIFASHPHCIRAPSFFLPAHSTGTP